MSNRVFLKTSPSSLPLSFLKVRGQPRWSSSSHFHSPEAPLSRRVKYRDRTPTPEEISKMLDVAIRYSRGTCVLLNSPFFFDESVAEPVGFDRLSAALYRPSFSTICASLQATVGRFFKYSPSDEKGLLWRSLRIMGQ